MIYHLNILPNLKLVIYVDFFNLGYLSPAEEHLPSLLWYCQRVPAYPAQLLWRPLPTLPQSCWGVSTYLAYSGTARECQPTQPSCCGGPYLRYLSPAGECPPTYATSVLLWRPQPTLPQSCWGVSTHAYSGTTRECLSALGLYPSGLSYLPAYRDAATFRKRYPPSPPASVQ